VEAGAALLGARVVRRARAGVGVVAAAAPRPGAAVAGPPRHGVPLPRGRRAADGAAQPGGQVPALAAGLPRRRAQGDALVPSDHEGARYGTTARCFPFLQATLSLGTHARTKSALLGLVSKIARSTGPVSTRHAAANWLF